MVSFLVTSADLIYLDPRKYITVAMQMMQACTAARALPPSYPGIESTSSRLDRHLYSDVFLIEP